VKDWVGGGGKSQVEHSWAEPPTGVDPRFSSRKAAVFSITLLLVACIVGLILLQGAGSDDYHYEAQKENGSLLGTVFKVGVAVFVGVVLLVGAGAVALRAGVWAWKYLELSKAEVAHAGWHDKAENGLSGWVWTKQGWVDLDSLPARRMGRDGSVPTAETSDHYEAADKSRMMSMVTAAGKAGASLEWDRPQPQYQGEIEDRRGDWEQLDDGLD
jgi:hypothetical protein